MPEVSFVYDDTVAVPEAIVAITGIRSFGALLFRRRRQLDRMLEAATAAGLRRHIVLATDEQRAQLLDELRADPYGRFLYLPADLGGTTPDRLSLFLAKLAYGDRNLVAQPAGAPPGSCLALLDGRELRRVLAAAGDRARRAAFAELATSWADIPCPDELICLSDLPNFIRFVTGSFDTRAFNAIQQSGRLVTKRSHDKTKMRREHDYWYQLPPHLQRFMVQPFGFRDEGVTASYQLERLNMPDAAVQWIHGAIDADSLTQLLDAVFDWLEQVPRQTVVPAVARAVATEAYLGKLDRRIAQFLDLPVGQRVSRIIAGGSRYAGLAEVVDHLKALLLDAWDRDGAGTELAVQHGDLCFSNILFDRRTGLVKFIDPKGACAQEEIWGDPYYDVAKLSHSVLGNYDFLNNDLFDVGYGAELDLGLRISHMHDAPAPRLFIERLEAAGFKLRLVRLYEASLFLSMLPLHAEVPRKVLGFVLNAMSILDNLGRADTRASPSLAAAWS